MSVSNGIIKAPVNTDDVSTVLGVSSHDVGTLCKSGKINMWSRMKPVHIMNALDHTGDAWWKGTSGNCGIVLSNAIASSYSGIIGKYTADKKNGWSYTPPYGGAVSPYRLTDFENYWHDALPPMHSFSVTSKVAVGKKLYARCIVSRADAAGDQTKPGALTYSDIADLSGSYFGIVITDMSGKVMGRVATNKAASGVCEFTVGSNFTLNSEYMVYPFLSTAAQGQNATDVQSSYYTVPNVEPAKFKVVTLDEYADVHIFLVAKKTYVSGELGTVPAITYDLDITTGTSVNILSGYVQARYNSSGSLANGEYQQDLGSFMVTSASPYSKTGTFSNILDNKSYKVNVYIKTNKGDFERSVNVLQISPGPL